MNTNGGGIGMGGGGGVGSGGGGYADYGGSPNAPTTHMGYGMGSGIGGGPGGSLSGVGGGMGSIKGEDMARSQHSLAKGADTQSMVSMGNRSAAGGAPPLTAATNMTGMTGITEASAPLMTGSSGEPTGSEQPYSYRAKALYNCESG